MQELRGKSLLTLIHNARIWTGDTRNPQAEAILLRGSRIEGVGDAENLRGALHASGDRIDRLIDGGRRSLLPGFVDAHAHLVDGGLRLDNLDLSEADAPQAFLDRIADHIRQHPGDGWVTGSGWDHQLWGGTLPCREWLDPLAPGRPLVLMRSDLHTAVANSRALELAGIDETTVDPDGGQIRRDALGRPTGVLMDRAIGRVADLIPTPAPKVFDAAVDRAQTHALSLGVTQVHDMGEIPPSWRDLELLQRARDQDRLQLRVHVATPLAGWRAMADFIGLHGRGDEWLWWGGVKGFVDGALGAGTAWFTDPYLDRPGCGITVADLDDLAADIQGADAAGLQPIAHAIGDAAVGWLGDVYCGLAELNGVRDRRPRLEHAQHLPAAPEFEARIARSGTIASMQPSHLVDDVPWMEERLGAERGRRAFAIGTLARKGAPLAFGSDWTVASMNPMAGLEAAILRRPRDSREPFLPGERISLDTALTAYTRGAARAAYAEGFSGTLSPGRVADFVILDGDIFEDGGAGVGERVVTRTFVAGHEVYTREGW